VQGELERALRRVLRLTPALAVAGRTDAGVHARAQVASFEAADGLDLARLQRSVNGMLAPEVVVLLADRAAGGFHARHSATAREYRYRIDLGPAPDPFTSRFVWHRPGELSVSAMRRAAGHLVGERDFASFGRGTPRGASTVRRLDRLAVSRKGDRVEIAARAGAFLHHMVRSLVGTLVAVGGGAMDPDSMPDVLAARDRGRAGPVAPPHGLMLERVVYGRALTVSRSRR
jgi:tRNA pseudouridine38-40 synthase